MPRAGVCLCILILSFPVFSHAQVTVSDVTVTDVTSRSFSVVWKASEPVESGTTVRVFSAPEALPGQELTGSGRCTADPSATCAAHSDCAGAGSCRQVAVAFTSPPAAAALGIAKVTVTGLGAAQQCFFQIETVTASGTTADTVMPPLGEQRSVTTAAKTRVALASGEPITNGLLRRDLFLDDGVTPAEGELLLVGVEGGAHPISTFVGEGFQAPAAVVNMNNFFSWDSGETLELTGGQPQGAALLLRRFGQAGGDSIGYGLVPGASGLGQPVEPLAVEIGDVNADGAVDSVDGVVLLNVLVGNIEEPDYGTPGVDFHPLLADLFRDDGCLDMDTNPRPGSGLDIVDYVVWLNALVGNVDKAALPSCP